MPKSEPLVKLEPSQIKREGKQRKRGSRGGSRVTKQRDPPADVPEDVKPTVVPPPTSGVAASAPPPQPQLRQDARVILNAKWERVASGTNTISALAPKKTVEPRYMSTDIRRRQKEGQALTPKRKLQVDSKAASHPQHHRPGL